jgi:hypothetical protein
VGRPALPARRTIAAANRVLVDHHSTLHWPSSSATDGSPSVDGLRFVVPQDDQRRARPALLRHGSGVTYLNGVSDQLTGLYTIVVPGTLRDSL